MKIRFFIELVQTLLIHLSPISNRLKAVNAQLSGEQRTDQVTALHHKTLYLTHSKTATR
ncbi:hypothetical protein VAE063_1020005 [Vibrio aestuarianus]|uniref:Uncharacterized protein n=1 Tax=Vibrio aestuarianus TaxID=28171 RepID=A0ABM9FK22_9VIBR|nr:hypothetical protein VAE063_1020005 [Vibrio aestuarianus]